MDDIIFECHHCELFFTIIIHAVFKNNMSQINPHLPKKDCEELVVNNLVIGCAKPLQIVKKDNSNNYIAIKCDYI